MNDQTFGTAMGKALTAVQASQGQSTKPSTGPELERKRAFLQTFRRWEILFRRKDGDIAADRWLIAEYYKVLGHLPPPSLDTLTDMLIRECTFFPSIAECLRLMRCDRYDYSHPFHSLTHRPRDNDADAIGTTAWHRAQIEDNSTKALPDGGTQV